MNKVIEKVKKRGLLLNSNIYDKLLKIQLEMSLSQQKRISAEKTFEYILDKFNK